MRLRLPGRAAVVAALAAAVSLASLAPAAAVGASAVGASAVTFDPPTASAALGQPATFSVTFSSPTAPTRVELLRHLPGSEGDLVVDATVTPTAGRYMASVVDESHVVPNTTIGYRFRVTTADGVGVTAEQSVTVTDGRFPWRIREGRLIRLHWYQGDDAFADRALKAGEDGLARAMDLLGVTETRPVDFFIYADGASFRSAMGPGTSENVAGRAIPSIRTLFGNFGPADVGSYGVEHVIPHELTHLVFGSASDNPYHFPAKWLNEGLAVYMEPGGYSLDLRARVESASRAGTLMPLDGIRVSFPRELDAGLLSYAEGASAVDFFVRRYGKETLAKLIHSYATGLSDDDAFKAAIGVDVASFNDQWIADFGGRAASAVGPQPAPPGPVPSDWTVASPAPGSSLPPPAPTGTPGTVPGASAGSPSPAAPNSAEPSTIRTTIPNVPASSSSGGRVDMMVFVGALAVVGLLLLVLGIALTRRQRAPPPPAEPPGTSWPPRP